MAKERLFPEPQKESDTDTVGTRKQFENVAAHVFSVSKEDIDKREKQWRSQKKSKP